jgi:DnaJ-class molecular chaperone
MANRPSQRCLACNGNGWLHAVGPTNRYCPVCGGAGRITIAPARVLKWYPVVHRKRRQRAQQLSLLGGGR